ncbi:Glutathione S-transferase family protein [Zea mays]|uniref:Glutathione S-transferase family protein n=1 Tax=Zea mays TaxID=4577 RepID=A0A1D6EE47_MAIZE|nr:Glutathione S-transferase family protein [Zea mays]
MRSLRAAQTLVSRSLFSARHLSGAASPATAAAAGARWCAAPAPPPRSPLPSSRVMPAGVAGAVSFSLTFATVAAAEAKAKERPQPDLLPQNVVLYQYQACPFCNKVRGVRSTIFKNIARLPPELTQLIPNRAFCCRIRHLNIQIILLVPDWVEELTATDATFLDYHDIPYKVVEVNPLSKKELKWSDYKKVPILTVDGEQLVDSSDIINILQSRINPNEELTSDEEAKWRRWVDEHLVHVLSPNIYRTTSEALESFDYIAKHGNFSFTERFAVKYAGAAAMYMVSKKLKKKYNITDERASLYDAANTWIDALNGRDFLGTLFIRLLTMDRERVEIISFLEAMLTMAVRPGGSKPNLADLAVFGVLRPIRYLRAGKDMVENTEIGDWYRRMEDAVGEPSRIQDAEGN